MLRSWLAVLAGGRFGGAVFLAAEPTEFAAAPPLAAPFQLRLHRAAAVRCPDDGLLL